MKKYIFLAVVALSLAVPTLAFDAKSGSGGSKFGDTYYSWSYDNDQWRFEYHVLDEDKGCTTGAHTFKGKKADVLKSVTAALTNEELNQQCGETKRKSYLRIATMIMK